MAETQDKAVVPGNIDLHHRPIVYHAPEKNMGDYSTVYSMTAKDGPHWVNYPSVSDTGQMLTPEQAFANYKKTGKHLGKFTTLDAANKAAENLHEDQALEYQPDPGRRPTVGPPYMPSQETQEDFNKRVQAEDRPVEPTNSPLDYAQMAWGAPALARAVAKYGAKALGRGAAQAALKEAAAPVTDSMLVGEPSSKFAVGKVLTPKSEGFVNVAALSPEEAALRMGPEGKTLRDLRWASAEDLQSLARQRMAERTNPGIRPAVDLKVTSLHGLPARAAETGPVQIPRTHTDDVLDWLKGVAGLPRAAVQQAAMAPPQAAGGSAQWDPARSIYLNPVTVDVPRQKTIDIPGVTVDLQKPIDIPGVTVEIPRKK